MDGMYFNFVEFAIKLGRNNYWIVFKGFCDTTPIVLEFCGTELKSLSGYPPEDILERLRKKMVQDYGRPPYDEERVKCIFAEKHQY